MDQTVLSCFVCQIKLTSGERSPDGEDKRGEEDDSVKRSNFANFIQFAENHLELNTPDLEGFPGGWEDCRDICQNCNDLMGSVCHLYEEMCQTLGKLSEKLQLLSSLLLQGSREEISSDGRMGEMRNILGSKCQLHRQLERKYRSLSSILAEESDLSEADEDMTLVNDKDQFDGVEDALDAKDMDSEEEDTVFGDQTLDDMEGFTSEEDPEEDLDLEDGRKVADESPISPDGMKVDESGHHEPAVDSDINTAEARRRFKQFSSIFENVAQGKIPRPFPCDLCDKIFTRKRSVLLHKQRVHHIPYPARYKPYACDMCGKMFKSRLSRCVHKRRLHSGAKTKLTPSQKSALGAMTSGAAVSKQEPYSSMALVDPIIDIGGEPPQPRKLSQNPKAPPPQDNQKSTSSRPGGSAVRTESHPFECDVCHRYYARRRYVDLHKKNVHQIPLPPPVEKPFFCDTCHTSFKSKRSIRNHIQRFHLHDSKSHQTRIKPEGGPNSAKEEEALPKTYSCHLCSKTYLSVYFLTRHVRVNHVEERGFRCPQCPLEFAARRLLTYHHYEGHKKETMSLSFMSRLAAAKGRYNGDAVDAACVVCGVQFLSWSLLHKHLTLHEKNIPETEKTRKCYFCSQQFAHEQSIWAHLRSSQVHDFTKVDFCCDHAEHWGLPAWTYETPAELEQHLREAHPEEVPGRCGDCNWPFLNSKILELHKLGHLPRVKGRHQCPTCHNLFQFPDTLRDHYNANHGTSCKLYRCRTCKCGFSTKNGYRIHVKLHKDSAKKTDPVSTADPGGSLGAPERFSCPECPKIYSTAIQLRDHKRTIHVTKQCQECGLVVSSGKLNRHMVSVHGGAGKHLCKHCGKVYHTKGMLSKHMSRHGIHRFSCPFCPQGYSSGRSMLKHVQRMHPDKAQE